MSPTTSSVYSEHSLFEVAFRETRSKRRPARQYSPRFDRKRRGGLRMNSRSSGRRLNHLVV